MKLRSSILAIFAMILLSCNGKSGIEESIKIYDADMNKRFIQILIDKNVSYRVAPDGQIYYPIEQREKVKAAQGAVFGSIDESKKGASVQKRDAADIASRLTSIGINYEVFHDEQQATFTWSPAVNTEAMRVVSEVVSAREKSEK